jgi:DNA-binding winged helix-turn-helix (wHTH) protein/tetratricopeptide (TPR) repeat protein
MLKQTRHLYEFGPFRIDPVERLLLREGQPVHLTTKVFDTLLILVQATGHLIEKPELMRALWADSFVEEGNLTALIWALRKALGDEGGKHKYIQTVSRRGYRFVGDVREVVVPESAKIHSLAVLPFRSLSSEPSHDHLRIGLADAIITKLGSTEQIIVRPTTAVLQYAPADKLADPQAIGREQRVDAILAGHIEALSDRIRVTVQLVYVSDGSLLWADSFEESLQQIFVLEDRVAERVKQSMSLRLSVDTKAQPARRHTEDSKAYRLYLEGRYFWNKRTKEGLGRSTDCFQRATIEDPQYALAFAGIADSYVLLGSFGVGPALEAWPIAKTAAIKALELDDSLAEAHASLGMVYFYYEWNWPNAEREFQRAIALTPNYIVAHNWYALNLAAMGRLGEALVEVRRAEEIDPLSLGVNIEVGRIFYWSRKYDRAIEAYRKVIDLNPHYARAHTRLGMAYAAEGSWGDAIHEFKEAQQLSGADPYLDGLLGYAEAMSGNLGRAQVTLEDLKQRSPLTYVPAFSAALVYIGLGEYDSAFEWLERAYQDRSTYLVYAKTDPLLDPVRSDPRFFALLQRMGLQ